MALVMLEKGLERILPGKRMRRLVAEDSSAMAHRVDALDPVEKAALDAQVADPILPGGDALPRAVRRKRRQMALRLLQGGNVCKATGAGVGKDSPLACGA
eukprot:13606351-Alexandrium_andersonii.AAC.1